LPGSSASAAMIATVTTGKYVDGTPLYRMEHVLARAGIAVSRGSLLGKAISYTRNQWKYLSRYVIDGRAPVDNNILERDIRPFATSRNSWLFADTVAGAKASATVYSLVLTCRACNVEPYAYLHHVLTEMPQRASDADISDLLPFNFAKRVQLASTHP
jgi:transposase